MYGQPSLIQPLAEWSGPVYAFTHTLANLPVVTAGIGYENNRSHAPDEHIRIQDFLNGARHIARIIRGFADP